MSRDRMPGSGWAMELAVLVAAVVILVSGLVEVAGWIFSRFPAPVAWVLVILLAAAFVVILVRVCITFFQS